MLVLTPYDDPSPWGGKALPYEEREGLEKIQPRERLSHCEVLWEPPTIQTRLPKPGSGLQAAPEPPRPIAQRVPAGKRR